MGVALPEILTRHTWCDDEHCIERQFAQQGFRDDLRHHENGDKNRNMGDGDVVGGQSDEEEDTDDNGDGDGDEEEDD